MRVLIVDDGPDLLALRAAATQAGAREYLLKDDLVGRALRQSA